MQYLGKKKLYAMGFEQNGKQFKLSKLVYDRAKRKMVVHKIGWIRLDRNGYVLESQGFPILKGQIVLHQNTGNW